MTADELTYKEMQKAREREVQRPHGLPKIMAMQAITLHIIEKIAREIAQNNIDADVQPFRRGQIGVMTRRLRQELEKELEIYITYTQQRLSL